MVVGDHQLDAAQPAPGQRAQELGAEGLSLGRADRHAEHLAPPLVVDRHRDGDRNRHAVRRLRRWLCLKHKVRTGKYVRFAGTAMALLDGRALETIPIMEYVCERTYRALAIEELRAS